MLTRRRFLAVLAAGVAGTAGYGRWIEPGRVTVTRHTLGDPRQTGPTLRLVQLTDFHLQRIGRHEREVAAAVRALDPQVLVITGDAIDRADRLGVLAAFLDLLPGTPHAFATLGNWEHWSGVPRQALHGTYARRGIRLLVDETVEISHAGRRVLVTGLDDATAGHPDLRQALRERAPAPNHVLLAHSPAYRDRLAAHPPPGGFRPQCILSGHTHGGQVNLGGWAPMRPPGSGRYVGGWYTDRAPQLYVSRGIGTSVVPVRFGAPPEIAVFEWHLRA